MPSIKERVERARRPNNYVKCPLSGVKRTPRLPCGVVSLVRRLRTVIALSDSDVGHGAVLSNFNSFRVLG